MNIKPEYDVIVVGAGPAGSITAMTAARAGLNVLLIEKKQEIGEPVRCAEGLHREGMLEFIVPEDRMISSKISKAIIHSPGGKSIEIKESEGNGPAGYILDRKIFDREMARRAAAAGSDVHTKTQATEVIIENATVKGIKGVSMGKPFEARSEILVGADGIESNVGRWAGINTTLKTADIASCAQYLVSGIDIDQECCQFYPGNNIAPGGYLWIFPKGDCSANIGLGIHMNAGARPAVYYLDQFMRDNFPDGKILQVTSGGVPIGGMPEKLSSSGLVLVGDAARLSDPLTGGGIYNAMVSGRIAAEVIISAIRDGDCSSKYLKRYDNAISMTIGKAYRQNIMLKDKLFSYSDRKLELLLSIFKRTKLSQMELSELYHIINNGDISMVKSLILPFHK